MVKRRKFPGLGTRTGSSRGGSRKFKTGGGGGGGGGGTYNEKLQ